MREPDPARVGWMVNMASDRGDSDQVLVTGASGFIGSATVRALLRSGYRVRVLVEPERSDDNLAGLEVERVVGDIRDAAVVDAAVDGASDVFHLAAVYRFWAADPDLFYDVNVGGTMNVLRAGAGGEAAGGSCTRARSGRIGVAENGPPRLGAVGRALRAPLRPLQAVEVSRRARGPARGRGGLPVVLVHPTFPVGEGDSAPTPTGRTIVEFLNGRIPAYVDTALERRARRRRRPWSCARRRAGRARPELHPRWREHVAAGDARDARPTSRDCRRLAFG